MASFHENMDKMVLECQTTLGFTASREMVKVMMVTTGAGSRTNKRNSFQSCRQARQLLQDNSIQLAKYAVRLLRKDLKMKYLVGLLTRHNSLSRHLTWLKIKEDPIPMCPLCGEEWHQSTPSEKWETKKTMWKTSLSSKKIKTGALEHTLEICQKLQEVLVT